METNQTEETITLEPQETVTECVAVETGPSIDQLLAEAEQRGYMRGRNEVIAERLKQPSLMAEPGVGNSKEATEERPDELADDLSSRFLSRIRPSVWDL